MTTTYIVDGKREDWSCLITDATFTFDIGVLGKEKKSQTINFQ